MTDEKPEPERVRLDVWLDVSCLFKTRSEAQKACDGGKVDVNGQAAKPHRLIHVDDKLRITRPLEKRQLVVVRRLAELRQVVEVQLDLPVDAGLVRGRAGLEHVDTAAADHAGVMRRRFYKDGQAAVLDRLAVGVRYGEDDLCPAPSIGREAR